MGNTVPPVVTSLARRWNPVWWRVLLVFPWVVLFLVGLMGRWRAPLFAAAVLALVCCIHEAVWQALLYRSERRTGRRIGSVAVTASGGIIPVRGALLGVFQCVVTAGTALAEFMPDGARVPLLVLAFVSLAIVLAVPLRRQLDAH